MTDAIAADAELREVAARHGVSPVPPKSACVCCPSTRPCEVDAMADEEPAGLGAALAVEAAALPTLRRFDGLWRRDTAARPGSWIAYAAAHLPGAVPAPADVVSTRLQPCTDPDLTGPPPEGVRYAVRSSEDEITYLPMFRDALQAAGDGQLQAWINGAWFTSDAAPQS